MATGTRKKEGDVSVVLQPIPALEGTAAAPEEGRWEDW